MILRNPNLIHDYDFNSLRNFFPRSQNLAGMSLDVMSGRQPSQLQHPHLPPHPHLQYHHPHQHHPHEQRPHFAVDAPQHLLQLNPSATSSTLDDDISDYSILDFSSPPSSCSSSTTTTTTRQRMKSSSISSSSNAGSVFMPSSSSSASVATWSKSSKNTQSLDRSLKKSKGSRIFSRNADYGESIEKSAEQADV